jgi:two-component system chemotaxis response regulator CheB
VELCLACALTRCNEEIETEMTNTSKDPNRVQNSSGFAGTLRNIQLIDIVQMCCLAGTSLCVRVRQDNEHGTIYIQEGEVVHAHCGSLIGVEAFFTILGWQSGQFDTMDAAAIDSPTIKKTCQFLLMEAARQADEQALARESEPVEAPDTLQEKLRVLIVDDSPIMAKILSSMLAADPAIDVVGTAENGEQALEKMKRFSPDLITMDVNMPVMGGSTALMHIMIGSPCPVLIMSNFGPSSYPTLLSFLNLGAVDFMSKPVKSRNIVEQQQRMVNRIHMAAKAHVDRFRRLQTPKLNPSDFLVVDETVVSRTVMIINAGPGGYLEVVSLITAMPQASETAALSMLSIPPPFAPTLASFLNLRSRFEVIALSETATLSPGRCHLGASGAHLEFAAVQGRIVLGQSSISTESANGQSFDHLLVSATQLYNDNVVVVLLSGAELGSMQGLNAVKAAGGKIVAPELDSCILPATIEPAKTADLITDTFHLNDARKMMGHYCT